jgi:hypothetical protein
MTPARLTFRFPRLFLALVLLALCCRPALANPTPAPQAVAPPVSIDISGLTPFLDSLPPDEKDEQLRDWALYGLKSSLALGADRELPVRHPALAATQPGEVSPGRVFPISGKEWGVIVAPELLGNKPLLGGLIDRKNATCNSLPEKVSLFTYRTDAPASVISVAPAGSLDAKELFAPEYGYHSATVGTLAELSGFLERIDDLVSFSWRAGRLHLGGRKYLGNGQRALTAQEVAALYQAYFAPAVSRRELEQAVQQRYAELLRSDAGLQKRLRRGTIKKAQVLAQLRRQLAPRSEPNVGFSLDPQLDYAALADDLRNLALQRQAPLHSVNAALAGLLSRHRGELNAAAARLESRHDLRPLLTLRRRYEKSADPAEQRFADTLRYLETRHSYQSARYDGKLQGTSVGMILFYTDLLAKLWALDYQGMAPKKTIKGFRTMQEISVPKLDWDDFVRLSKTRLWFGLRGEGFDLYGDQLLFQPAVTRVYAASSDPLYPGKETPPNYQSKAFLGWWDSHYETVAAVEPYYHKLDQIQKWGCAFLVLKEKKSHLLDYLQSYPVQRNLDFESWLKTTPVLAKVGIPFLDRRNYGRSTECFPLLKSRDYQLMGRHYVLSGGVSLASRKDILAKLHKHDPSGSPAVGRLRGNGPADGRHQRENPPGSAEPAAGSPAAQQFSAGRKAVAGRRKTAGQASASTGERPAGQVRTAGAGPPAGEEASGGEGRSPGEGRAVGVSASDRKKRSTSGSYGTFTAEKEQGAIKLKWEKSPAIATHELVASLAALQQAGNPQHRSEAIFGELGDVEAVVRVRPWGAYLVKTASSGNRWMYLEVNPAKLAEFPARSAAAFPEADIFGARLVSDANARKMAVGKTVVR